MSAILLLSLFSIISIRSALIRWPSSFSFAFIAIIYGNFALVTIESLAKANALEIFHYINDMPHVAVCISGQTGRMLPRFISKHLFEANPDFKFHLFYNLNPNKKDTGIVFNTPILASLAGFQPSFFIDKSPSRISYWLGKIYNTTNVDVKNVSFWDPMTIHDWGKYFDRTPQSLDFIAQYKSPEVQATILNMYRHHVNCALQIQAEEESISRKISTKSQRYSFKYDYIISTREDIFLFNAVNVSKLASFAIDKSLSSRWESYPPSSIQDRPPIEPPPGHKSTGCDVQCKNCLNWSGLNMRFQFFKRDSGITLLLNRLTFYNLAIDLRRAFPLWLDWSMFDFENPEEFEKYQSAYYNMTICYQSVRDIPATAVRKTYNGNICFQRFEVQDCYPSEISRFLEYHKCLKFSYPQNITTFDDYFGDIMDSNKEIAP